MSNWKLFRFVIILLIGTGQITVHADEASHRQAVEQLFELTSMQQKIDESVASVLALQIAQNPGLKPHQDVVNEFLERHIGWGSLKDALSNMYMHEFTEQEVNDMNTFYSSPTGRKVIERLPVLVQMRNQLASQRLQENIGELEYEINARQKQQEHP
ncbi:MAG: DUF2059 domain-containing protein [Pseudomonadota bacterium]